MKNSIIKALCALLLCSTSTISLQAMDYSDPYDSGYEPKRTSGRSPKDIIKEQEERNKEREAESTRLSHSQIHDILYDKGTSAKATDDEDDEDQQPAPKPINERIDISDSDKLDDQNQQQADQEPIDNRIDISDKPNVASEQIESYVSRLFQEYRNAKRTDLKTSDENLLARIITDKTPEIAELPREAQEQIIQLFFEKIRTEEPKNQSISDQLQQSSDSIDQLLRRTSELTNTDDEFSSGAVNRKTEPTKTTENPFSLKSRWKKFSNEFWKGKSWKNFKNLFSFEKTYVKTVITDALAGDEKSINLFGSKEAKDYIKNKYTSAEKRELITSMSKSLYDAYQKQLEMSRQQSKPAEVQLEKNTATIDKKLAKNIQAIQNKLEQEITILTRVKELKNDSHPAYPVSNTIMDKIKSEFNLTLEQASEYARTGTTESEIQVREFFAKNNIIALQEAAREEKQQLQSEFDTSVFIPKMKILQENIGQLKSIGTRLSTSLEGICNTDQQIITTYDRHIENDIVNFVDFSKFTFDPTKSFEENINQLVSDQNLNVPVHQAQGKDQFNEQLRQAMVNHYAPKYADMLGDLGQVSSANVVPTILERIPNFELFPQDLQTAILQSKGITLDETQQKKLTLMEKQTLSIDETEKKAAALLAPQHFEN